MEPHNSQKLWKWKITEKRLSEYKSWQENIEFQLYKIKYLLKVFCLKEIAELIINQSGYLDTAPHQRI